MSSNRLTKVYNWQQDDWPAFSFSLETTEKQLFAFAAKTGTAAGLLKGLADEASQDAVVNLILSEAIKTSQIEGENPNRADVLSSIRKNLGLSYSPKLIRDKAAEGLGELMTDARRTYREPLTEEMLFEWHRKLFAHNPGLEVGKWRTHAEPMQVISGASGKERVHFEAPPSSKLPKEMKGFVKWFNDTAPGGKSEMKNAVVRSALAHLYFESVHPFEDGNGRIGRAVAEKALSQTLGRPALLSLSTTIEANRNAYYAALEKAQRSNEVTAWVEYFVDVCLAAQTSFEKQILFTVQKSKFFNRYKNKLNDRQQTAVERMFDEGPDGFEGGMNARKYVGITKTSKATATRDLQDLLEMGVFVSTGKGGGRSTSYMLNLEEGVML